MQLAHATSGAANITAAIASVDMPSASPIVVFCFLSMFISLSSRFRDVNILESVMLS